VRRIVVGASHRRQFRMAEGHQLQQRGATGEALRHLIKHHVLLRAGQHPTSHLPIGIDDALQPRGQFWRTLRFVDHRAMRKSRQPGTRIRRERRTLQRIL